MGEDQYPYRYRESETGGVCTCLEDESRSSITSDGDIAELAKVTGKAPQRDYRKMRKGREIVEVKK